MKGIDFLEVLGGVDQSYILEAESPRAIKWNVRKIISYAATFLVIGILSFSAYDSFYTPNHNEGVAETSMEDMGRGMAQEPSGVNDIDGTDNTNNTDNTDDNIDETDNKNNFFEEIFENIASFFKSLRL